MNNKLLFFILFVIVLTINVSAWSYTDSNSPTDEWRMYGRDTGYTRFTNANAPANISNTTVRTFTMPEDVDNSPIIVEDDLYIVADSYYSSHAFKLNATNISQKLAEGTRNNDVTFSLVYYRDSLFYHGDSQLYQINASNLSQLIDWEDITDAFYQATPTVYEHAVYVGDGNYWPKIRQFNASNISKIISTYSTGSRIYESTPVLNGYAYGASSSGIALLNASNLAQSFGAYSCGTYNQGTFAVDENYVYKSCGYDADNSYTIQLNATNITHLIATFPQGNLLWKAGPTLGNGYVYVAESGNLYQLNASNISIEVANYSIGSYTSTPFTITEDYAFIASGTKMYQFNATNISHLIATYTAGSTINGGPVVAQGFLYFGVANDLLYQLGVYTPLTTVRLKSPVDGAEFNQSVKQIDFNCTAASTVGLANLSLYLTDASENNFVLNQTVEISGTRNASSWTLDMLEGNYTWNCLVADIEGTTDWGENRTLRPDLTDPVLSIITPAVDSFTIDINLDVNYSVSDFTLDSCWYSNDSMAVNITLVNCTNITDVVWIEGPHNITVWANDSKNHLSIESVNFTVDLTNPVFTSLVNQTNEYATALGYNINTSDTNFDCFAVNDTTNFRINCSGFLKNNTLLSLGMYHLNITINDSAGNVNSSLMWVNVSDTIAPDFSSFTNRTIYDWDGLNYNLNATDAHGVSCFSVNDTINFKINCSGNLENNTFLGAGLYWLNVSINDSSSNMNSSLLYVNVSEKPFIALDLLTSGADRNATQNWTFQVSVNVSCSNTDCGEVNASLYSAYGNTSDVRIAFVCYSSSCTDADDLIGYLVGEGFQVTANPYYTWTDATLNTSAFDVMVVGGYYYAGYYGFDSASDASRDVFEDETMPTVVALDTGYTPYYLGITSNTCSTDGTDNNIIDIRDHNIMDGFSGTVYVDTYSDDICGYTTAQFNDPYTKLFAPEDFGSAYISGFVVDEGDATVGTAPGVFVYLGFDTYDTYPTATGNDTLIIKQATCWAATGSSDCAPRRLVNSTIGATPFFVNSANPSNVTLNENQSVTIIWNVNATGAMDIISEFLVGVNKTSDLVIGNVTSSWNMTIAAPTGLLPPLVNVVYPVDGVNYGVNVSQLNYTVSRENLSKCWYSTDGGVTNSSAVNAGVNFTNVISSTGSNTWVVYCNNTNYSIGSDSVTFVKDLIPPGLSLVGPTLSNGTTTLDTFFVVNASITGEGLDSLIYNWNGTNYTIYNDSLILMYNFENVSSLGENDTFVFDISGHGNNGTIFGGTSVNAVGKYGRGFEFDGVNDYVNTSYYGETKTLSFWFKTNDFDTAKGLFGQRYDAVEESGNWQMHWHDDSPYNRLRIYTYDSGISGGEIVTTTQFQLDQWYHVVITSEANDVKYYVNGAFDSQHVWQDVVLGGGGNDDNLVIGGSFGNAVLYPFNGTIDEVRVWNRTLDADEVYQQFISNLRKIDSENWGFYINQSKNATSGLDNGEYNYRVFASDEFDNVNLSNKLYVIVQENTAPTLVINNPLNNSIFNGISSLTLNASVYDVDAALNNLTVWFYGGYGNGTYSLLNASYNQSNGTTLTYDWTVSEQGSYNFTVVVNDERTNSSVIYLFDLISLNFTCEAGGPYQQGALVLVQGSVANETGALVSQSVNVSLYDSSSFLNTSQNLSTADDGGYETTFSELSGGSYTVNATTLYQGLNISCSDTFSIGGSASFVLDKIVSVYNISNSTVNYNVTLKVTNKGLADATFVILTDSDSSFSPYNLSIVSANSTVVRSYIANFTRQDTITYQLLAVATVNGTDPYSDSEIVANSTEINLTIPDTSAGKQVVITKNIVYVNETSLNVIYNVSATLYNSGSEDLTSLSYVDSDINDSAQVLNLSEGSSSLFSNLVVVAKAASNTNNQFALGTATTTDLSVFYSNRPIVRIPGYGGPADATVSAPASVVSSAEFDSIITVLNMNPDIGQDFIIDYWITNENQDTNYSSGQQTIYVGASGSSDFTAALSAPSTNGNYRLRALVTWAGGTAPAYDSFVVTGATSSPVSSSSGGGGGGGSGVTGSAVEEIVCNPPYIRHGIECCLDKDGNSICDEDDVLLVEEVVGEEDKGVIKSVVDGEEINFAVVEDESSEDYFLEVVDLSEDRATIIVSGEAYLFYVDSEREIDLNGDGVVDLYVSLLGIEDGEASFFFRALEGVVEVEGLEYAPEGIIPTNTGKGVYYSFIVVVILLVLIILYIERKFLKSSVEVISESVNDRRLIQRIKRIILKGVDHLHFSVWLVKGYHKKRKQVKEKVETELVPEDSNEYGDTDDF